MFVCTWNYILDVQISYYKLEGQKMVDNEIIILRLSRFVYHFFCGLVQHWVFSIHQEIYPLLESF